MNIDTMYGGGTTAALLDALAVPGHPSPILGIKGGDSEPLTANVSWQNGAHMTMRLSPRVVHFQELCSAVGRERPTGLYTALVEQLIPVLKLRVPAITCEPATDFAKDKLGRRGEWQEFGDFWIWWLRGEPDLDVLREARTLVATVQAERSS